MAFFISNVVSGFLVHMQIFSQLYNRISRGFDRSGATQAVALDISKPFNKFWCAALSQKLDFEGL